MIDRSEVEELLTMLFNLRDAISQASDAISIADDAIVLHFRTYPKQVRADYPDASKEEVAEIARKRQLARDGSLEALRYWIAVRSLSKQDTHGENHD